MFKNLNKENRGFTIIEVLIVLAIAGLIMLIVFLAIPALQRNQRNNARNSEASRIATAVSECLGNRNGVVASCMTEEDSGSVTAPVQVGQLQRFDGGVNFSSNSTAPTFNENTAGVWYNRECTADGSGSQASTTGTRSFVVLYQIEDAINRCISS